MSQSAIFLGLFFLFFLISFVFLIRYAFSNPSPALRPALGELVLLGLLSIIISSSVAYFAASTRPTKMMRRDGERTATHGKAIGKEQPSQSPGKQTN